MVGALLSAVIFTHFWCREFSLFERLFSKEFYSKQMTISERTRLDVEGALDRLWLIGKLTSVPGSLAGMLMVLLLLLVLAYHPWLSPTPMPMSRR